MGLGLQAAFAGDALSQAIAQMVAERRQAALDQQNLEFRNADLGLRKSADTRAATSANLEAQKAIRELDIQNFSLADGRAAAPVATPDANGIVTLPPSTPQSLTIHGLHGIPGVSDVADTQMVPRTPAEVLAAEQAKKMGGLVVPQGAAVLNDTGGVQFQNAVKPPAPSEAEMDAAYQVAASKQAQGIPLSPDDKAMMQGYEKRKALAATTSFNLNEPDRQQKRLDNSYGDSKKEIDQLNKPVSQYADRLSRLQTALDQRTPQADSLLAPELLSIMAGGQGTGVRMNEAEMQRIVGGRSNWEGIKAAMNQWSLDPNKALSVTDAQRQQMRSLVTESAKRNAAQVRALNEATRSLNDATTVDQHRAIMGDLQQKMNEPWRMIYSPDIVKQVDAAVQASGGRFTPDDVIARLTAAGVIK